jgi:Na+/citrate or Na+/malate symporter
MKTEQSNLLNSLTLITVGLWGYFDVSDYDLSVITSFEHWTALIPVVFGFVLLLCHKGVKNNSKLVAHIAVVITLFIFIALVGKRLPISIEQGGAGLFRVIAMSLTSFLAMITFVKSFIANRKKS